MSCKNKEPLVKNDKGEVINGVQYYYVSPFLSVIGVLVCGLIVTCLLGYTIFPMYAVNPFIPSIIYTYVLHPLCRYNLNFSKAYPQGFGEFICRIFIGHVIVIPLNILKELGN